MSVMTISDQIGADRLPRPKPGGRRPRQHQDWIPISCKISPEARRRLKVGQVVLRASQEDIVDAAVQFYLDYRRVR